MGGDCYGYKVSFGGDKNVLELMVVAIVHICEDNKSH